MELQQTLQEVNLNWSKDQIIRYLYVSLAPYFKRDLNYFMASPEEKYAEYQKGFIPRGYNIVCSTLADYYVQFFETFGIRSKKVIANSAKIPLFAVIVEGDYGWFFIDPLNDLFHNQYGLQTTEFGTLPHYKTLARDYPHLISLPKEYIQELDDDLEFPKKLDDYFTELHLTMTDRNLTSQYFQVSKNDYLGLFQRKMDFSNEQLINLGKVSGAFERIQLYLFLERTLFFRGEKKNIKICLDKTEDSYTPVIEYTDPIIGEVISYQEVLEENQFVLQKK